MSVSDRQAPVGPELVVSGISGLDRILHGGFLRGNVILVEGAPGTGKSTLGLEFLYRGARDFGEPGLLVLFDVAPDRVARAAGSFGWDLRALERERRLKIVFTTRRTFEQELQDGDSLLIEEAREIGARRIVVDGLGAGAVRAVDRVRERFHSHAAGLQREGLTAMFALDVPAGARAHLAALPAAEFVADTIVLLRLEPDGRKVTRSLEVAKSRGQAVELGRHSMLIGAGGIEVYPVVLPQRRAFAGYDPAVRLTTGVPGLDELVNGGLYRASATLVLGPAGTGKSLLGLQFLAEGGARGEHGLLISLEEPASQVIAGAATVGIDLRSHLERGTVRVWSPTPEEIEPARHLYRLEEHVAEVQPLRVVIDSLSAYGAIAQGLVLRDLLHSILTLLKASYVTTIGIMEDHARQLPPSSLFDNMLRLDLVDAVDAIRLVLRVVKLRANPSARGARECEIAPGVGLRVLPGSVPGGTPSPHAGAPGAVSHTRDRLAPPADGGA